MAPPRQGEFSPTAPRPRAKHPTDLGREFRRRPELPLLGDSTFNRLGVGLTTRHVGDRSSSLPYNVGRVRAKKQFEAAYRTQDPSIQQRRLQQAILGNEHNEHVKGDVDLAAQLVSQLALEARDKLVLRAKEAGYIDKDTLGRTRGDSLNGGFTWIRKANQESDRKERRDISASTRSAIEKHGYTFSDLSTVHLRHIARMVHGTKLVSPTVGEWPVKAVGDDGAILTPRPEWSERKTVLDVTSGVVLGVAVDQVRASKARVAVVNAASAYHSGGGFLTGGRHALEEAMCIQSTLFASLLEAEKQADRVQIVPPSCCMPAKRNDGSEWQRYVPDDGVIFSPYVEVFRQGSDAGYPFEKSVIMLDAVISVAMPNCNERMSDAPIDAETTPAGYRTQLEQKWRAVLSAAAYYSEADTLVLPDAGCGVYRNQASTVGAALGLILRQEFDGRFARVILACPAGEFVQAAFAVYEGRDELPPCDGGPVWPPRKDEEHPQEEGLEA